MRGEVLFFFDLEVVPREATLEEIEELGKGTAPSNYRDPDKIARYESHKAEELYRAWAFDPLNCEIVCCSYAIGTLETTKHGEVLFDGGMVRTLRIDQHDIIADLDRIAEGLLSETQRRIKVIAHNVKGYDAPVLMANPCFTFRVNKLGSVVALRKAMGVKPMGHAGVVAYPLLDWRPAFVSQVGFDWKIFGSRQQDEGHGWKQGVR